MDILFESKYTRNKEVVKELYKYLLFKRPATIIANCLIALCIPLSTVLYINTNEIYYLWLIIIGLLGIALRIYTYSANTKMTLKRDAESNHGKMIDITLSVTDEYIEHSTSNGTSGKLEFSNIKKVRKSGKTIYIITKANLVYLMPFDSFTIGNAEDFIKFISRKIKR